jgi:ketosteroid isomerase-like protein
MKLKRLWLVISLFPLPLFAQSPAPSIAKTNATVTPGIAELSSPPPAPDAAELTKLLNDFLAGASRNDLAAHERFWADDLIYTGSVGRRLGKADILREVREEGPPKAGDDETIYSAEDIRVQQYGDTAIVAFRLIGTTKKVDKTELANYLNSGTFLKRNGKWQVVSWQATKMPAKDGQQK